MTVRTRGIRMKLKARMNTTAKVLALAAIVLTQGAMLAHANLIWPSTPLSATVSAKPLAMLVAGRDHKLFYEAYNDASDIDGDGLLDVGFKPSITYFGLFDSTLCYSYSGNSNSYSISDATNIATENAELFEPVATAGLLGVCAGATHWSGNWLNYVTTSRIDALRKVLYGGLRDVDTATRTVLRRAYIPQDAHSWGKEYHSIATSGYDIREYTPLDLPVNATSRHFFGNMTGNIDRSCATLSDCSNLPPLLRIRRNVGNDKRIWEWASKERPVLAGSLSSGNFPAGTGAAENFTVRAEVCKTPFTNECKFYPNGTTGSYKPIGLLHEYGENEAMLFGLMTGSYDKHMSGGRLRKVISSFANEVNPTTGQFLVGSAPIVDTFNNLRIRGFNQSSATNEYWKSSPYADSAKAATEGQLVDWGNPIGEMMMEGARYFAGAKAPLSAFDASNERTIDAQVGLTSATWDDPYENRPYCSRANFLVISDVNPSFDSNQVRGAVSTFSSSISGTNIISSLDAETYSNLITGIEAGTATSSITGLRFIGQSGTLYDAAPTPKNVTSLANIRGLAPEEPTKQGSYYSAAVAYWAKSVGVRTLTTPAQTSVPVTVDSYVVALSSPLPSFDIPMPGDRKITMVPFAKSVGGSNIVAAKGAYQPTNQIVDFYVEELVNSSGPTGKDYNAAINGGRYSARFQINFEDVEQGGDHDMDAIALYEINANANGTLSIKVTPTYQAGGIQQNMGYVISGTTKDGVYLVARDETTSPAYFLNVPKDREPGYCETLTNTGCNSLPAVGALPADIPTFTFSPGSAGASLLKGPLWYLAKYGGYTAEDAITGPNRRQEWDANNDGTPDSYFLVQNPLNLRTQLRKALENISSRSGSGGSIIANSTTLSTETLVFQATFNSNRWSGDLLAYPATSAGVGATPAWNAAARIPEHTGRKIFYWSDATGLNKGREFTWGSGGLSAAEKALFDDSQPLFNYLRGDRSGEVSKQGNFRDRLDSTVLGDISHSSPAFSKETQTVFVGANDGMLHAFTTKTAGANGLPAGSEMFAYIPSTSLPKMKALAATNYNTNHQYYVDGDIAVSNQTLTTDRIYLIGLLGRGGKGMFGLDVTTPESFSANDVKWEYTNSADADLGFMLGRPIITRIQDGRLVALVGNGYNSSNGSAALYVVELATGTIIRKLVTPVAGNNGLATPGTFDANNDGEVDFAYAGDMFGNVWKFNLTNADPANWTVDNNASPIFVARNASNAVQPITGPMSVAINTVQSDPNLGKRFVFFGTGSYFLSGDPTNTSRQTLYSFIDSNTTVSSRANMTPRIVSITGTFDGKKVRSFPTASAGDMFSKDGCYVDLPETGERMITTPRLFNLAEPTLLGSTIVPVTNDQCVAGGNGYINAINPFTCARLSLPFFDINDNNSFLDDVIQLSGNQSANISSIDLGVGMPGEAILIGNRLVVGGSDGRLEDVRVNIPTVARRGRLSWREIVRD